MTYQDFKKLHFVVGDFKDNEKELFIADNGGEWMDDYTDDVIVKALSTIWDIAKGGFNALRKITGLSQQAFSDKYSIAKRTLEDWGRGVRSSPPYVMTLLAYAVLKDEKII